jgi:uncharacterized membrane protein
MFKILTFKLQTILMEILQNVHSYLAYVVLAMLILAVFNALAGWLGKKEFTMEKDLRVSLFTLILSHIQLILGLIVYFVSDNGLKAIQTLGMGGLNAAARLLALEHPLINIIAIALITIGWSRHKKKTDDIAKFKSIAIFYGLGLLLILSRIPWGQWFN